MGQLIEIIIFTNLKYEQGVDLMTIIAEDPLKYAKKILFFVIPDMHRYVFVSKSSFNGATKSSRDPVNDELVYKLKSNKILFNNKK